MSCRITPGSCSISRARLPRRAPTNTVIANAQNARVDSMNGAPRIAPIPISLPAA